MMRFMFAYVSQEDIFLIGMIFNNFSFFTLTQHSECCMHRKMEGDGCFVLFLFNILVVICI